MHRWGRVLAPVVVLVLSADCLAPEASDETGKQAAPVTSERRGVPVCPRVTLVRKGLVLTATGGGTTLRMRRLTA